MSSPATSPITQSAPILPQEWVVPQLQAHWPGLTIEEIFTSDYSGKFHCRATVPNAGTVGIRVLAPPPSDPAGQQRLLTAYNNLQKLAQMEPKGAIRVLQAGSLAGSLVVVTEWVQGMPLPEYLQKFPPGVELALSMIDQLAQTLGWYHEQGITLGRFKTDSVLVLPDGRPMITGMSLTDLISGMDPPAAETTKRVYMAPETQGASIEEATPLVDMFSFGTVAYEILTTQLPVGMFAVAPSDHTGAGKWLDEVIYKAFHPKANARTQSMAEFRAAMQAQELKLMDLDALKRKAEEAEAEARKPGLGDEGYVNEEVTGAWCEFRRFYIFLSIFALTVFGTAIWIGGNIYRERMEIQANAQAMAIMLGKITVALSKGESVDIDAVAEQIAKTEPDQQLQSLKSLATQFIAEGRYTEALMLVEKMAELTEGSDHPDHLAIQQLSKEMQEKWGAFLEAMTSADMAALQGNEEAEHEALLAALKINPYDRAALRKLSQNAIEFRKNLKVAEKALKIRNPEQKEWHISFHRELSGVHLNLSGHQQLKDITPLAKLPFDYLDLRHTATYDLFPLTAGNFIGIALDHTKVTTLNPLVDTRIESLGLRGTPIENFEPLARLPFLKHLRVSDDLIVLSKIEQPTRNSDWENLLGMRFSPVPNTTSVLFGTREVTEFDYQQFLDDTQANKPTAEANTTSKANTPPISLKPAIVKRKDAVAFCKWLTEKDRFREHIDAVMGYRLPNDREVQTLKGFLSVKHTKTKADLIEDASPTTSEAASEAPESSEKAEEQPEKPKEIRDVATGECIRGFYDVLDNANEWVEDNRPLYWKKRQPEADQDAGFRLVLDFDIDR